LDNKYQFNIKFQSVSLAFYGALIQNLLRPQEKLLYKTRCIQAPALRKNSTDIKVVMREIALWQ